MQRRTLLATLAAGALMSDAAASNAQTGSPDAAQTPAGNDPGNMVNMKLKDGVVVIRLRPDLAPLHVERVKALCAQHFYDNTPFHRVIEGFMAQGGDPTGTGTGGSQLPDLKAEFTREAHFLRGTVGAARSGNPDSANSQFYIMFAPAPSLDGQYTIWGNVVSGMEFVDKIKRGNPASNGVVSPPPDRVITMRMAGDNS